RTGDRASAEQHLRRLGVRRIHQQLRFDGPRVGPVPFWQGSERRAVEELRVEGLDVARRGQAAELEQGGEVARVEAALDVGYPCRDDRYEYGQDVLSERVVDSLITIRVRSHRRPTRVGLAQVGRRRGRRLPVEVEPEALPLSAVALSP